ncbi:MAG: response regulator [Desulfobacteraceae bacterium]|nr:response regulator [Desulfobacteraceae bacterium]MBC2756644.1 response regulator [Desulfobacteraceae bacterium]
MDKVLILDGDADYVHSLKSGLDKIRQFEVETATRGEKAIALLEKKSFSVFVTEIFPPDLDALDLLSFMTRKRPNTPCIIMTDQGKPWFKKQMAQQSFLYHLEKPFKSSTLASAILVGLNLRDEGKNFRGMTMTALLPLIESLQKTCRLEVASKNKGKGYLYFNDGRLIDAHFKELSSEGAAQEIVKWDRIFIKVTELPRSRTRTRVKTHLMEMAGASWHENRRKGLNSVQLTPEYLSTTFNQFLEEFNRIKGYQALAVIGEKGEILASDQKDEIINIVHLVGDLKNFFPSADKEASNYINLGKGEAFTLHKEQCILIILKPPKKTNPRIRLIGVTSPMGNWFYMKKTLEKMLAEIVNF